MPRKYREKQAFYVVAPLHALKYEDSCTVVTGATFSLHFGEESCHNPKILILLLFYQTDGQRHKQRLPLQTALFLDVEAMSRSVKL